MLRLLPAIKGVCPKDGHKEDKFSIVDTNSESHPTIENLQLLYADWPNNIFTAKSEHFKLA